MRDPRTLKTWVCVRCGTLRGRCPQSYLCETCYTLFFKDQKEFEEGLNRGIRYRRTYNKDLRNKLRRGYAEKA